MRVSLGQYALRVGCGLGLLWLPATGLNLCPQDGREAVQAPAASQPDESDKQPERKSRKHLALAAGLPDVAPPRWPSHLHLLTVQRGRPLPAAACPQRTEDSSDQGPEPTAAQPLWAVRAGRLPPAEPLPQCESATTGWQLARRVLFFRSLLRTGPPLT